MRLKEYDPTWPPSVMIGGQIRPTADMEDIVLSAENCANPKGQLRLMLGKKYGRKYTVVLPVPASRQEQILLSIMRKKNMTLREVGELLIE
jgi:hypothetical protein